MDRDTVLKNLRGQLEEGKHIIGASVGSGLTAKLAALGGADILLVLSAGKYRIMGRSSLSSYFCFGNNNAQVMELGEHEIFPLVRNVPLLFGLMATDPTIHLYDFLKEIKAAGFSGIVNFPTVTLIDGKFRAALEEEGTSYEREIAAIKLANHLNLFTMAFVTNEQETLQMLDAGADVICVHLGLTKGGFLGAKKYLSLDDARKVIEKIFNICKELKPEVIRMIYAGPANTLVDMRTLYKNTDCLGYIGGSTFDRLPIEKAVLGTVRDFKQKNDLPEKNLQRQKKISTEFVCRYVEEHYREKILLEELARAANLSKSYLSVRFKEDTGVNFSDWLMSFRLNKAKEVLEVSDVHCKEAALAAGYTDYAQFTKMFKKFVGVSPSEYKKNSVCVKVNNRT